MSTSPRTLADELRARSDAQLAALLTARPDLLSPPPGDIGELAVRATAAPSVWQAITRLDTFCLQTLEALLALPEPCDADALARVLGTDPAPALDELRTRALVWGPPDAVRAVHAVHGLLREPAGLGPSARDLFVGYGPARLADLLAQLGLPADPNPPHAAARLAGHLGDPAVLHDLLERAPGGARVTLETLTWGPPTGTPSPDGDVDWLLAHGLVAEPDPTVRPRTVVLPREVALVLRGGRVHRRVALVPPPLDGPDRDPGRVEGAAAGSAASLVRLVDELLTRWARTPPPVLRGGGLGVRELRRAGAGLGVPVTTVRLLCALTLATGLLDRGGGASAGWTPTEAFDRWHRGEPGLQWAVLAQAWLTLGEDPTAGGQERAWEPGGLTPSLPQARALVLDTLAAAPAGRAVTTPALLARLRWAAPRWSLAHRAPVVEAVLAQAALVGVTGLGALSSGGRALAGGHGEPRTVAAQLRGWLPERVTEVLIQGDLTAVAPGPLVPAVADELRLVADVESTGAGSVYRFSPASVRRALDAGRSAGQIEEFLATHSRTPLPQPLRYLITDTARRHGQLRVGPAASYLRCEDPALLAGLAADPLSARLGMHLVAPGVAVAEVPASVLLTALSAAGYVPAVDSDGPGGAATAARTAVDGDAASAPGRPERPGQPDRPENAAVAGGDEPAGEPDWAGPRWALTVDGEPVGPLPPTVITAAVRGLRGVPALTGAAPSLQEASPHRVRAVLVEAARTGQAVWVGYAERTGAVTARYLEPVRVVGGSVLALDRTSDRTGGGLRQLAVSRITGIAPPATGTGAAAASATTPQPEAPVGRRAAGEGTSTA